MLNKPIQLVGMSKVAQERLGLWVAEDFLASSSFLGFDPRL